MPVRLAGQVGIDHTRWATHGVPAERNAHSDVSGGLAVVHNGIIENHAELRERLTALGYAFTSDTDTETVAHLIQAWLVAWAKSVKRFLKPYAAWWLTWKVRMP